MRLLGGFFVLLNVIIAIEVDVEKQQVCNNNGWCVQPTDTTLQNIPLCSLNSALPCFSEDKSVISSFDKRGSFLQKRIWWQTLCSPIATT